MVTALYRRYRPEAFAELIGQAQVTTPLMTALRNDRVNHAYLFSGPRGCGKTTSARILARCLNCAEGPTDTPCGKCPSCIELSRDGSGSLDVVEIDAASHNGVDDARDLRERAAFAPARDRYKIFILDEAHMVTPQGFNALLKIVEEPPAHVKFIFATTEPDKVISTIRSRTHHYPFRLVPPAQMHEYLESLCKEENVTVEPGVIALVVRAGGGSVRDSLSLLDQLMAGSDDRKVSYDRAVALLGFTHGTLLDSVIDAFAAKNSAAVFASVDSVIQTGQDPRRFVEDLLERLRDLIVVLAVGNNAGSVLRGVPNDEIEKLTTQAFAFGMSSLTHASEVVSETLNSMSGATSPKLQLELMCARVLVPASSDTEAGSLARLDRLERRIGVSGAPEQASSPVATSQPASPKPASTPDKSAPAASAPTEAIVVEGLSELTTQSFKDSWADILSVVNKESKAAWMVAFALQVIDFDASTTVLTLKFPNERDLETFKTSGNSTDVLRRAINSVLGVTVKFKPQFGPPATAPIAVVAEAPAAEPSTVASTTAATTEPTASEDVEDDAVALLEQEAAAVESAPAPVVEKPKAKSRNSKLVDEESRYGESLLREMLGAEPVDDKKNGR
jgi:DNA polymerase III subunit gamma/tau